MVAWNSSRGKLKKKLKISLMNLAAAPEWDQEARVENDEFMTLAQARTLIGRVTGKCNGCSASEMRVEHDSIRRS